MESHSLIDTSFFLGGTLKKKKKTLCVLQAMVSKLQWNMMASAQKMSVEKKEVPSIGKRWADSLEV